MSNPPKDPPDDNDDFGDPESFFIPSEPTPEEKARRAEAMKKLKAKAELTHVESEEETLPGVESIMGVGPLDDDFDDDFVDDFGDDFDDDDETVLLTPENIQRIQTNRIVKPVVYGFYGLAPDDCLENSTWHMMPNGIFRPAVILAFPVENQHAVITSIKCGNTEQLIADNGIPASVFKCEYTLDLMIDRYFDAKSTEPKGIVYLVGDEMDGRGHGGFYLELETVTPGVGITVEFTGKLRGLLLLGAEAINPPVSKS